MSDADIGEIEGLPEHIALFRQPLGLFRAIGRLFAAVPVLKPEIEEPRCHRDEKESVRRLVLRG
jgi:hypothetical protein